MAAEKVFCGLVFFGPTSGFRDDGSLPWCAPSFVLLTNLGTCRSRIPMSFPLLDSFPHIFAQPGPSKALSVNTSLSTDTTVALRIKTLQQIVGRAISIDEREALSNSLGVIAEAYEEGWDSGTDEDDD